VSILFTNLVLAGLLALALVPLIVHLFARSKPPKFSFSDNSFLQKILKKSARYQKPQDIIILILRTLLLLAILTAFLGPLLVSKNEGGDPGGKDSLVVVIDRSASMSATDGASSRFDSAIQSALTAITESNADVFNVVWIDSQPSAVFPESGENVDYINEQLNSINVSYENGNISRAVQLAVDHVESVTGSKRILVISDFQEDNWKNASLNVPSGVSLEMLSVADSDLKNVGVSEIHTIPSQPISGEEISVVSTIENYSDEARRVKVYIDSGGGRTVKEFDLQPWGNAEVVHQITLNRPGETIVSARVEEDGFACDDVRFTLVQVKDRMVVGTMGEQMPDALVRLAAAIDWLTIKEIKHFEELQYVDYLHLSEWNGENVDALVKAIDNGLKVIVEPGLKLKPEALESLLDLEGVGSLAVSENQSGWSVNVVDAGYKAFNLFAKGAFGAPGAGTYWKKYVVNSKLKGAETGEVLLAERTSDEVLGFSYPGDRVSFLPDNQVEASAIKFVTEDENIGFEVSHVDEGMQLISNETKAPGVYSWKSGDDTLKLVPVNVANSESDLRRMDPSDLKVGDVVSSKQLLRRAQLGDGLKLWPWLLVLGFIFMIAELIVVMMKPKTRKEKV